MAALSLGGLIAIAAAHPNLIAQSEPEVRKIRFAQQDIELRRYADGTEQISLSALPQNFSVLCLDGEGGETVVCVKEGAEMERVLNPSSENEPAALPVR